MKDQDKSNLVNAFQSLRVRLNNIKSRTDTKSEKKPEERQELIDTISKVAYTYPASTVLAQVTSALDLVAATKKDLEANPIIGGMEYGGSIIDYPMFLSEVKFYNEELSLIKETIDGEDSSGRIDVSTTPVSKIKEELKPQALDRYQIVLLFDYLKKNDVVYKDFTNKAEAEIISYLTGLSPKKLQNDVMGRVDSIKRDYYLLGSSEAKRTTTINLEKIESLLNQLLEQVREDIKTFKEK